MIQRGAAQSLRLRGSLIIAGLQAYPWAHLLAVPPESLPPVAAGVVWLDRLTDERPLLGYHDRCTLIHVLAVFQVWPLGAVFR